MKRLLHLGLATFYITAVLVAFAGPPASAFLPDDTGTDSQSQAEARECRQKFNGKVYADGSTGLKNFNKDTCASSTGNCKAKPVAGTPKSNKVTCTQKAGTNSGGTGSDPDSSNNNVTGDVYTDDALDSASSCTTDNCDIISNYINPFIRLLTVIVGLAVVIGIIIGGIQVATSEGDPQKAASGKDHIRNALIAMVAYVILFSFLQWVIPGGVM